MRIKDVIDEEISVTPYEGPVTDSVNNAVKHALGQLLPKLAKLPKKVSADLESEEGYGKLFRTYVTDIIEPQLIDSLSKHMHDALNSEIGEPMVSSLKFEPTEHGEQGYASETNIVLDNRFSKTLTRKLVTKLIDSALDSYDPGERVAGFTFIVRMASSGDRYYWGTLYYEIEGTVSNLVSTTLHELVHVIQYNQQDIKGRDDIEYRSYLDKHKGEFRSIVDRTSSADDSTEDPWASDRFWNLYLSSPQEISAFAHQAALNIIKSYELHHDATTFENITSDDIIDAVDTITSQRFKNPKSRKELMVRKRYMKLVYLEVARYVDAKKRKK